MRIWVQDISKHVEMGGILPTAPIMFVIIILNVVLIIAYPTIICAMVDKTVHLQMTKKVVLIGLALVYFDVLAQKYAYMVKTFVMICLSVQVVKMNFSVNYQSAHLPVTVYLLQ